MLLHRGSIAQVFCGLLISFAFGMIHAGLCPYRKGPTNWLKACIEIQIFLTMLISLVARFADKLEADALDKKHYEWLVITSFFLLVPGGFVVCSALTVRQSRLETRKTVELVEPLMGSFSTLGGEQ